MEALKRHMTASTVTGYLAIFGLSVAFAAGITAESSGPRVLQAFVMGTPNMLTQADNPMSGALFDAVGFYNHPCYVITGEEEAEMCEVHYGITTSLQTLLANGTVAQFIHQNGLQNTDREEAVAAVETAPVPAPAAAEVVVDSKVIEIEQEQLALD